MNHLDEQLFIIDGIGPFFRSNGRKEINWSKIDFSDLDASGLIAPERLVQIETDFRLFVRRAAAMGYNAITLDDLAHLTPDPLYPNELSQKIEQYRTLYRTLFQTADEAGLKVFITTDLLFFNPVIEQQVQNKQKKIQAFAAESCRQFFKDFPETAGIIFRIGELDLMRTCQANLEPIQLLYIDEKDVIQKEIMKKCNDKPLFYVKGYDSFYHSLWKITDEDLINHVKDILKDQIVYIADGHHRYQTALNFAEEMRKKTGITRKDAPFNYIMIIFVNMFDTGLSILPTHRLLKILIDRDDLLSKLNKYFTIENASRIDASRDYIEQVEDPVLRDYLLYCLLEAVSRVSNTAGVHGAYLKQFKSSALVPVALHPEPFLSVPSTTLKYHHGDFMECLGTTETVLYVDPPYNSRQYASNYHLYETLVRWDNPKIIGVTGCREWTDMKSDFCIKTKAVQAVRTILQLTTASVVAFSYSSDGLMSLSDFEEVFLDEWGTQLEIQVLRQKRFKADTSDNRTYSQKLLREYLIIASRKNRMPLDFS